MLQCNSLLCPLGDLFLVHHCVIAEHCDIRPSALRFVSHSASLILLILLVHFAIITCKLLHALKLETARSIVCLALFISALIFSDIFETPSATLRRVWRFYMYSLIATVLTYLLYYCLACHLSLALPRYSRCYLALRFICSRSKIKKIHPHLFTFTARLHKLFLIVLVCSSIRRISLHRVSSFPRNRNMLQVHFRKNSIVYTRI